MTAPAFSCPMPNAPVSQQFGTSGNYIDRGQTSVVCKASYYLASGLVSKCMKCACDGSNFACQFDLGQDLPLPAPGHPDDPAPILLSAQMYAEGNAVDEPGTLALIFKQAEQNPCPNALAGTAMQCP